MPSAAGPGGVVPPPGFDVSKLDSFDRELYERFARIAKDPVADVREHNSLYRMYAKELESGRGWMDENVLREEMRKIEEEALQEQSKFFEHFYKVWSEEQSVRDSVEGDLFDKSRATRAEVEALRLGQAAEPIVVPMGEGSPLEKPDDFPYISEGDMTDGSYMDKVSRASEGLLGMPISDTSGRNYAFYGAGGEGFDENHVIEAADLLHGLASEYTLRPKPTDAYDEDWGGYGRIDAPMVRGMTLQPGSSLLTEGSTVKMGTSFWIPNDGPSSESAVISGWGEVGKDDRGLVSVALVSEGPSRVYQISDSDEIVTAGQFKVKKVELPTDDRPYYRVTVEQTAMLDPAIFTDNRFDTETVSVLAALELACHSAECAPPPVGSGGSDSKSWAQRNLEEVEQAYQGSFDRASYDSRIKDAQIKEEAWDALYRLIGHEYATYGNTSILDYYPKTVAAANRLAAGRSDGTAEGRAYEGQARLLMDAVSAAPPAGSPLYRSDLGKYEIGQEVDFSLASVTPNPGYVAEYGGRPSLLQFPDETPYFGVDVGKHHEGVVTGSFVVVGIEPGEIQDDGSDGTPTVILKSASGTVIAALSELELACHSAECAPPPVGTGGSLGGDAGAREAGARLEAQMETDTDATETVASRLRGDASFMAAVRNASPAVKSLLGLDGDVDAAAAVSARLRTAWQEWHYGGSPDPVSYALQAAAAEEFGGEMADYVRDGLTGIAVTPGLNAVLRAALRAKHADTQARLDELGVDGAVRVYRGVQFDLGAEPEMAQARVAGQNPISSWSTARWVANDFAYGVEGDATGTVMRAEVPRDQILSLASFDMGTPGSYEVVVLGSKELPVWTDDNFPGTGSEFAVEGELEFRFNPAQPRDEDGKWTNTGAGRSVPKDEVVSLMNEETRVPRGGDQVYSHLSRGIVEMGDTLAADPEFQKWVDKIGDGAQVKGVLLADPRDRSVFSPLELSMYRAMATLVDYDQATADEASGYEDTAEDFKDTVGVTHYEMAGRAIATRMIEAWGAWQGGSEDEFGFILQRAALEELQPLKGYTRVGRQNEYLSDDSDDSDLERQIGRIAVRARYELTQKNLRARGIGPEDNITLYRGMVIDRAEVDLYRSVSSVQQNPLSSWATEIRQADKFANGPFRPPGAGSDDHGLIYETEVPAKAIFSLASYGFGATPVKEVVLGTTIVPVKAIPNPGADSPDSWFEEVRGQGGIFDLLLTNDPFKE